MSFGVSRPINYKYLDKGANGEDDCGAGDYCDVFPVMLLSIKATRKGLGFTFARRLNLPNVVEEATLALQVNSPGGQLRVSFLLILVCFVCFWYNARCIAQNGHDHFN